MSNKQTNTPSRRLLEAIERSGRNLEQPLSAYDEESLRQLKDECGRLYEEVMRLMDGGHAQLADLDDAVKCALTVHHETILRNKSCALFYLRERLEVLARLRTEAGLALPAELRSHCSSAELEFFADYDKLYGGYCRDAGVDLRGTLKPPRDLYVEIRCNVDCGEIVTAHAGVVKLDQGTSHFLRRADVEHLISQGLASHVVSGTAA